MKNSAVSTAIFIMAAERLRNILKKWKQNGAAARLTAVILNIVFDMRRTSKGLIHFCIA